jgi:iron complex outermembrane recepter protein
MRMGRSHGKCGMVTVAAALVAVSSFAQGQATTDPTPSSADRPDAGSAATAGQLEEVIVTATRQAEPLSRVPISVTAISQGDLDLRGITSIDDVARVTPGLNVDRAANQGLASFNNISIRGIESNVGAATTGIYIDDTPIQIRTTGYTFGNAYPELFDLSRIEVLRGPQGTLFGSGSEGGTVRFITPDPGLDHYTVYSRSEVATIQNGGLTYEAGAAAGGPIIDEQLGFRASAYFRRDGGWIDHVDYSTGQTLEPNANYSDASSLRLAFAGRLFESVLITPSFYHQDTYSHSGPLFWESLSAPGDLKNGNTLNSPASDRFSLPALKIQYETESAQVISNTSYLDRNTHSEPNYTEYVQAVTTGSPYPTIPGEVGEGNFVDTQQAFTEEIRAQSRNPNARFNWVVGAFYNRTAQLDEELVGDADFPQIVQQAFGANYLSIFGTPLGAGNSVYTDIEHTVDKQAALFTQLSYKLTERLKVDAGVRAARQWFDFSSANAGPFAGSGTDRGSQSATPITPKYGLSYQADSNNLFYVSAAKGFRPGGAQRTPPSACAGDLAQLGLSSAPKTYNSDSVWSYEVGAKNRLLDGRVQLDSSAFWINWNNIQQNITLVDCGQTLVGNLGSATSKGVDFAADVLFSDALRASLTMAYTDASFDRTIASGGVYEVVDGAPLSGISPFAVTVSGQYNFNVGPQHPYLHLDYQINTKARAPNPLVYGVDPTIGPKPETQFLSLKTGVLFQNLNASIFVDNLLNQQPELYRYRDVPSSSLYYATTWRPRTFGVQLTYAY